MTLDNISGEIEVALLATLLNEGHLIYDVVKEIKPKMFSSTVHQNIYGAMCVLGRRGIDPNPLLVSRELMNNKVFEESGGSAYVSEILSYQYNVNSLNEYIKNIDCHDIITFSNKNIYNKMIKEITGKRVVSNH